MTSVKIVVHDFLIYQYLFYQGWCPLVFHASPDQRQSPNSCSLCNAFRNGQQRESLHPHDIQGLLWQVVVTDDLFGFAGQTYALVTDVYSKHFGIEVLRQNTATCVINSLKKMFARFAYPRWSRQLQRVTVQQSVQQHSWVQSICWRVGISSHYNLA